MKKYDYILVGSGLYAGVFAWYAKKQGKTCLVLEKRDHIGGNIYCEDVEDIHVHKYGAHIFHTSNKKVWEFVNSLAEFNRYTNSPVANYKGEMYNMPFNMNTFSKMWNISTPAQAKAIIEEQKKEIQENKKTLAKQALELTQNQEALRILMEILREAEKEVEEKGEKSKARKRLEQAGLAGFLTPEIVRDFLKERG